MWLGYSIPDSVPGIDSSLHSGTSVFGSDSSGEFYWRLFPVPEFIDPTYRKK
jgi:hypothetical protein